MSPILSRLGGAFGFGRKNAAGKTVYGTLTTSPTPASSEATDGLYTVLTITANCTLTLSAGEGITADILMMGGGGGPYPSGNYGGGPGAGGVLYVQDRGLTAGPYPVSIGTAAASSYAKGTGSTFLGMQAIGGGGAKYPGPTLPQPLRASGSPGGSGGGESSSGGPVPTVPLGGGEGQQPTGGPATPTFPTAPQTVTNYGTPGFTGPPSYIAPRGPQGAPGWGRQGAGGGAGAPARSYPDRTVQITGGAGISNSITGSAVTYGAGCPPPKNPPSNANPNTAGRGSGNTPGSIIIRYIKEE